MSYQIGLFAQRDCSTCRKALPAGSTHSMCRDCAYRANVHRPEWYWQPDPGVKTGPVWPLDTPWGALHGLERIQLRDSIADAAAMRSPSGKTWTRVERLAIDEAEQEETACNAHEQRFGFYVLDADDCSRCLGPIERGVAGPHCLACASRATTSDPTAITSDPAKETA